MTSQHFWSKWYSLSWTSVDSVHGFKARVDISSPILYSSFYEMILIVKFVGNVEFIFYSRSPRLKPRMCDKVLCDNHSILREKIWAMLLKTTEPRITNSIYRMCIELIVSNFETQPLQFFLNALPSFAIWQTLVCDG